jgi:hypothetical protein
MFVYLKRLISTSPCTNNATVEIRRLVSRSDGSSVEERRVVVYVRARVKSAREKATGAPSRTLRPHFRKIN